MTYDLSTAFDSSNINYLLVQSLVSFTIPTDPPWQASSAPDVMLYIDTT
jgi:hypothetical protein